MKTFALSKIVLTGRNEPEPSLAVTLEQLRRYEQAESNLHEACVRRGIEKPKLVAHSR